MTHVVAEPCFGCKYTDCVVVCPVECFYEGESMLYIDRVECIDCEACVPECPVEAIFHEDNLPKEWRDYIKLNKELVQSCPIITEKKEPLEGTDGDDVSRIEPERYWLQYHNYDQLGFLPGGCRELTSGQRPSQLDTADFEVSVVSTKKATIENAIGDIVFFIVGCGAPPNKEYSLWSWHWIDDVYIDEDEIFEGSGEGQVLNPPAILAGSEFAEFKKKLGNFGLGFQNITNSPFLPRLIELARKHGEFPEFTEAASGAEGSASATALVPEAATMTVASAPKVSTGGAGYGDPEQNKRVENAAIKAVKGWYQTKGWSVQSVEREKCGFDLVCKKGNEEENVEVKGISGEFESFAITAGEVAQAKANPKFVLVVVTQALSETPLLMRYSAEEFLRSFSLDVIQYRAIKLDQILRDADGSNGVPTN